MRYITKGIHTRTEKGEFKIFPAGSELEPTKFELAMFPNKFVQVAEPVEGDGKDDGSDAGTGKQDGDPHGNCVNYEALEAAKVKLQAVADSDEWADEVREDAKKLLAKRPEKQHTVDALTADIEKFLSELEDDEDDKED